MELDILVVGSHPDDAEIGCGGIISHYKKEGKRIGILDLSNGEPTPYGTVETRISESKIAAKILNVDIRVTLNMKNRFIENSIENRVEISEIFRQYRPKLIITHPIDDYHSDHVACHHLVNAAKFHAKLSKTNSKFPEFYPPKILYFDHSHMKIQRKIDFLVDISDSIEDKINALKAYKSQFFDNKKNVTFLDHIQTKAKFLGYQIGTNYAEGLISPSHFQIKDITDI